MINEFISDSKLNIYVLNWNQPDLTVDCVNSLLIQTAPVETQIIIIDNGSTDGSIEIFKQKFPQLHVISNKGNLGFQGGMNAGIKHAISNSADFVMLLNNDTIADPKMIENLFLNLPQDAALASPAIFYHDDHGVLCSLGGDFHPVLLSVLEIKKTTLQLPGSVTRFEFLPSHAWLIKSEVFEQVGLLDEIFFPIYYDDLDFCLRLKRKDLPIYLIPQAKIFHRESMSVGGQEQSEGKIPDGQEQRILFSEAYEVLASPVYIHFQNRERDFVDCQTSFKKEIFQQLNPTGKVSMRDGL